jgi:hypothetical protein
MVDLSIVLCKRLPQGIHHVLFVSPSDAVLKILSFDRCAVGREDGDITLVRRDLADLSRRVTEVLELIAGIIINSG